MSVTVCPHCGGENQGAKIKCHHCGRVIGETGPAAEEKSGRSIRRLPGRMPGAELALNTTGERLTDITDNVAAFADGIEASGLVHVFLPHATAGLGIMEMGSGSESDLAATIDRLFPADPAYEHAHGTAGHGRDHLLPMFISPSLTIPCDEGRLLLGTWQRVVVIDTNQDNNERRVRLTFISGTPERG